MSLSAVSTANSNCNIESEPEYVCVTNCKVSSESEYVCVTNPKVSSEPEYEDLTIPNYKRQDIKQQDQIYVNMSPNADKTRVAKMPCHYKQ